ncbi:MAG: carbohydrate ABC transporter permease [Clostridia bacterium]|nr:carbohydrate ABC transporter permease [Clostridia bacterium]
MQEITKKQRNYYREPTWFKTIKYTLLVLFSLFFLFPIYALVINSVMPYEQIQGMRSLWPEYFEFSTYTKVFTDGGFKIVFSGTFPFVKIVLSGYIRYLFNTILVCILNISGVCIASSLTAYAISKLDFWGKNFVFACIMGMVLLPSTILSIPLYIIYSKLGWVGTLYPLWVPMWFGGGTMNIFLVRQFMKGIPKSYSEAASLDGANSFQVFVRIILPLVKPILIYLAVTGFFGNWNDFSGPLMYVRDEEKNWTLSLALYMIFGTDSLGTGTEKYMNNQMAVGVMMMIPCVILFAFFQKTIMEGISVIGVKG